MIIMSYLERFNDFLDEVEYTDITSLPFMVEKSGIKYEAMFAYRVKDNLITKLGKLGLLELNSGSLHISNLIEHLSADDIANIYLANTATTQIDEKSEATYIQLYEKIVANLGIVDEQDKVLFNTLIQEIFLSSDIAEIYKVLIRNN